jgi:hypothetical protein
VMTLREKLDELLMLPASDVQHEAMLYLQRSFDWPVQTQIRLSDLALVLAAMMKEVDPHVRRVMVTDTVQMGDSLG